jgi:hypothetical protein
MVASLLVAVLISPSAGKNLGVGIMWLSTR